MLADLEKLESEMDGVFLELEKIMRIYGTLYIKEQLLNKGYKDFKSEEELNETIDKVFGDHILDISSVFYEGLHASSVNREIEEFVETGEIT